MYDLVAMSYNRLSDEINSELLDVNPGLDKEGLAYAREVCLDFLQDDNDTLNDTIDDPKDEAEDEDTFDSLQDISEESNVDGSMTRMRGWGLSSYHMKGNKRYCNYQGERGHSGKVYVYNHVTKSICESKGNGLGHCYGYKYYLNDSKCEIWRVPIHHVHYVHGLYC